MSQKVIDWNLQARVESWNLIVGIAKSMRLTLSPVATTSYLTLNEFLQKKIPTEYSLIILCVTSLFIGTKSEYKDVPLDKFIEFSSKFVKTLNYGQKMLFNEEDVNILARNDKFYFHKTKSQILMCEIVILTYNNWEFITNHPFTPLHYWLKEMREVIRAHGRVEEKEQTFRQLRSTAAKYLCILIVSSEKEIDERIISGAAITQAFREHTDAIPGATADNWADKFVNPEEKEKIMELASLIADFQQSAVSSLITEE